MRWAQALEANLAAVMISTTWGLQGGPVVQATYVNFAAGAQRGAHVRAGGMGNGRLGAQRGPQMRI